jgi:hypothetical protein
MPNAPELIRGAKRVNDSTKLLGVAVGFNSWLGSGNSRERFLRSDLKRV